jgi:uncharacterized membrane protein
MQENSVTIPENEIPSGWSYNPSSWKHRIPLILVASIGVLIAIYLSLYQLRAFKHVWEPIFGNGSRNVLNSSVSTLLPFPDAILGVLGYLTDIILGLIGNEQRWRTQPYVVFLFSLVVGLMGITSIVLIILQPVVFHSWCTLCLLSALCSLTLVGPTMSELRACLQYLKLRK